MLSEHLEKISYFVAIATCQSVSQAARHLGVSQAGLSKSLSLLEEDLRVQLFHRTSGGMTLTKEGDLLLEACKNILDIAGSVETQIQKLKAARSPRQLRIGMYDSIAVYLFEQLVSFFKAVYPATDLLLVIDNSQNLTTMVEKGHIDVAFGVNLDTPAKKQIHPIELYTDTFCLYESNTATEAFTQERNSRPIMVFGDANDNISATIRQHIAGPAKRHKIFEAKNFETIKILTLQGICIGVLPTIVAKPLLAQKLLRIVQLPKLRAQFGRHAIHLIASQSFYSEYESLIRDVERLCKGWFKN